MEADAMGLAERVKELRRERHWTQADLARESGLHPNYIAMLETNRKPNPTQDTLTKLARAFGITLTDLLNEGDILSGPFPAPTLRELGFTDEFLARYQRLWGDLPRDQRAWLIGHLRIMADAERRVQAMEAAATAADDDPDRPLPAGAQGTPVMAHMILQ